MSRGNARQQIFDDAHDYQRYLRLVARAADRFRFACLAYCLMPNHVHLLVEAGAIPLSRSMQQLGSGYAQSFNRRYDRVGHLFQGRFKALLIDTDTYLLTVIRYIVLNPVEASLVRGPSDWEWSSYRATAGDEEAPPFLDVRAVWASFDTGDPRQAQRRFVEFVTRPEPVEAPKGPVLFGSRDLADRVEPYLRARRHDLEFVRAERFAARPPLEDVLVGAGHLDWCMHDAYWAYGYGLREIGAWLNLHPSTVWRRIHCLGRPNGVRS